MKDNWALLYACEVAARTDSSVVLAFNLVRNSKFILFCNHMVSLPMQVQSCRLTCLLGHVGQKPGPHSR